MKIRKAIESDAARIAEIWNPLIRETSVTFTTVEKTSSSLTADLALKAELGHPFLVLEQEGIVQGFATYGFFRPGPGYLRTMEHTVILAPAIHGQGAGRLLMARLGQYASSRDVHSLIGGVSSENSAGIAFHRRIGFEESARLSEVGYKFDRWMDLVLMQRKL